MSDQKCSVCGKNLQTFEQYVWRGKLYCDGCLFEHRFPGEEKPSSDELVRQLVQEMDKVGIVISDRFGRKHNDIPNETDEYVVHHLKVILQNLRIIE